VPGRRVREWEPPKTDKTRDRGSTKGRKELDSEVAGKWGYNKKYCKDIRRRISLSGPYEDRGTPQKPNHVSREVPGTRFYRGARL